VTIAEFTYLSGALGLIAVFVAVGCIHRYREADDPRWLVGVALGLFVGVLGASVLGVGLFMALLADNVLDGIGAAFKGVTLP
jgi:hypothetical protein